MSDFMISESVERLFSQSVDKNILAQAEQGRFQTALWNKVQENGLTLAVVDEVAGGIGETWEGAYSIFRGIGYWQVPLPLAETMIASQLLSMAGIEIPDGPMTLVEDADKGTLNVEQVAGKIQLTGSVTRAPWVRHCNWAVVSLADGRIALMDLKDPAVKVSPATDHAGMPLDGLEFNSAHAVAVAFNPVQTLQQPVRVLGATAYSIMIVGALERVLSESVQYVNDRIQFGKPIGKNQAIQQQLALVASDVAASRMAALVAAADMPSAGSLNAQAAFFSAAVAKVRCGEAATRCTSIAHQVHGAIGFTYEHSLHFATRRLWSWREAFGSDAEWAKYLGSQAILHGAAQFWPALTRRNFDVPSVAL